MADRMIEKNLAMFEAPKGAIEEYLAQVWRELLIIDRISRHDNFFALGGDSFLIVKLLVRLREIGLDTTVRVVFNASTLSVLASKLTSYEAKTVPINLISKDSTKITPEMLPLITLSQADIDTIIAQVPGGIANIQDIYGLTPVQNGMLYLMAKKGGPYFCISRVRFIDQSSIKRYADAMQRAIVRHDILRTTIFWDGLSESAQVVLRQVPSLLTEVTLARSDKPVLDQLSQKFDAHRYRLDLTQAPLLRLMAAPESDGSWMAVQLMHHSIIDHSTLERLQAEIHAIMDGKTEMVITVTPFRNFVAQVRSGIDPAEHTRFFSEMLGDIEEPTLPFGLRDVDQDGSEIIEADLKLFQTLNDQLRAHARKLQVSLASICHLAWAEVLAGASERKAVIFGTVLLGRSQAGEGNSSIMGPMINTLPIRLNIDERSVENAVYDAHNQLSALLAHEHTPLVLAQRCSSVPVGLPLFSALLNYRHQLKTRGVHTILQDIIFIDSAGQTTYPLTMNMDDAGNSLSMSVRVVSRLSATRICAYMQQCLESLVDVLTHSPQQSVRKQRVMPPGERSSLLHSWNQTTVIHSSDCCLHQLFEKQVVADGQAIAVECEGQTLTYSELNMQSNRLAHHIIAQGVKPDDRIALCVERGAALIVGILGILKAGCAYLPLDPSYSSKRATNILMDANPILLVADATGRNELGDHHVPVINLEMPLYFDLLFNNPNTTQLGLTPSHLAYIIYTSGSTGAPKGVMAEHQQIARLFEATRNKFNFNKHDRWCQFHSISFAVAFFEIWHAILYGSSLSMISFNLACSTHEFYDWICNSGITVICQTPSAFKMLMRAKNISSRSDQLRYIIFSGEALDPLMVKEWYNVYEKSGAQLVNMYGNTEAFHTALYRLEFVKNIHSIGRPLPDLCIYLLNARGEPVLLGAEGEIYISGRRVARGYLNRHELTAERFLPDPFREIPETRMYRTGDLARYLSDGNLVFLGRADQQVKIRGFRIEPGEIEARLIEHPQVHEAVVQLYGNGSDAQLVAYVVAGVDTSLAQNLRKYLLTVLPDYMVPAAYVCLSSLPLTPSGKLDRLALPEPDEWAFVRQQYEEPQGEIEEKLAQIWSELLHIGHISRHDNFFALGGHSLLIVQLLAQLRKIGLDSTVREVFDTATLAMLASKLNRYCAVTVPPNMVTKDSTEITPEMLPLITLSQADIDTIIAQVPGGIANIQDIYELTPIQNGMLYHHLMAKEGDPYLLVSRLHFTNRTTLNRYADAFTQLIERHDILRTGIYWKDLSEPAQVVLRRVPPQLTEITVYNDSEHTAIDQLTNRFHPRRYRLDLNQAPLLRLLAAPTSKGSWVALELKHHLICDNVTVGLLQTEILTIMNRKISLLATPTPFRNFVTQARLGIRSDEHKRFFTEMLGDVIEPTLPYGLNNVIQDGTEINEAYLELSLKLNDQLRAHARNLQVSVASICHLAWAQVVSKASGSKSVVFGTVLLGRLQAGKGIEGIVGPMINTLPIRLNVDESDIETAVRDTHTQLSVLLVHEQAPLVLAQRCSAVSGSVPLFSALLNYRYNQDTGEVNLSHLGVTTIGGEERSNYPFEISVEDSYTSLGLTAEVISPISATRVCAYMQQALESIVYALSHKPQEPVRKLTVIPTEEHTLLLHNWNQTTVTHSSLCCLHQLFEKQMEYDREAIAVEYEGHSLSYSELNIQANRLAHYLIAQGVKPDDRIALCVERSTTVIIAMLAILKAGCAYVPLDPTYSSQRLTNVLLDADPSFLLADATCQNVFGYRQVQVIDLEKPLPIDLSIDNPNATKLGLNPSHLAYVIYTSGSTGKPKGVMVEHQQVVEYFDVIHIIFHSNKPDMWCMFHSFSFDFSIWEIWSALLYGSQLSIVPYIIAGSANEFYEWICSNRINVLAQTPSAFKNLLRADSIGSRPDQLLYVNLGGEELDPMIINEWYGKYDNGKTVLMNTYGPTETTVDATFWICDIETSRTLISPIGRRLSNKRIYLLDSYGEPVPLGAEGEIYIGGAGVARGYFNRPDLTAERFLPDPFCNETSAARMYRTGDQARYLFDGNLVFLGRVDQQIKIRGFRIEPGEIEARLIEHPQVHEAVVQPYSNGSEAQLVAYVVAGVDTSLAQNLRKYLLTVLPDYMVPAAYVCLPFLPLTPSGKLDRRALPEPDEWAFVRQQYEEPQGEIEEKLAQIWSELLHIGHISRHDNFFALGGHSLLIVQLLAQLRKIGLDSTVREVFDTATLAMLASKLNRYCAVTVPPNMITKDSTEITPEMLPLITLSQADIDTIIAQVPGGIANIQDIYGLTPIQNGMLYHHLMAKEGDPYLLVSRLHFTNRTTLNRYADAFTQLIERHDILRTGIYWKDLNEPAQVVLRQVPLLLTEVTLARSDKPVLDQLSQKFDAHRYRLDLTQAPLLRLMAAPESDGSWKAMKLMHHSIIDHSTLEKLQAEMHAIMDGKTEMLTTVTPFRNYVAQTRQGMDAAEHTRFFTEMLGDIDEPTLPFGLRDGDQDGSDIIEAHLKLSQTLNDQLRAHARKMQVSLASICHLAWAQVLAKASGREAVVFGTVLLGRLQAGEDNNSIMGQMLNTLPIRVNINERSVEDAVYDAHNQLSALLAHEHTPLVLAQRCSSVPVGLPLFSALLNCRHNQEHGVSDSPPRGVSVMSVEERTNYPVSLSVDNNVSTIDLTVQIVSSVSATRICAYMQQCLESLVDVLTHSPQQSVRKQRVMPPGERSLLLHSWNQTTVIHLSDCCVHQLFEKQVEGDGRAIAVESKVQTLTYSELNMQANRLAHHIIAQGVKPDDRIALCVERSTAMIVGILGILKAGCAYVPLDPSYSSQRVINILLDSNPILLVSDQTGRGTLRDHGVPMIELEKPLPVDIPIENPDTAKIGLTAAHLAYIIYTSGSTGTPKGVMVEQQQIVRLFGATDDKFDFNNQDKWCLCHSISFDVSVWEIWGALIHGNRLSVPSYNVIQSMDELYDWICIHGVTVLNQTPSAFKMFMQVFHVGSRSHCLRYIILAGEWLDPLITKDWYEKYARNGTILVNMYGTTESAVHATIQRLETLENIHSIGRPLPDLCVYLLDPQREAVLLGADGEIYIGGSGVARGYLNRHELTADRFLPDPFNTDPTARMYRTGDLARYLPDGNLVFMGRVDAQVKIRGFRIEPGEIEARLIEHPNVYETVVQPYGNGSDARLVAYVVADADPSLVQNLRAYLLNLLPDYMVPTAYVCLSSLPLTPSGKLDRRSLPAPDDEAFARQLYEAPQGEMEEKLAEIWREMLNIDRISRHDNFFALGGHSLLIVRLLVQLRQIGLDSTVREVFDAPTLTKLASMLSSYKAVTVPPNLITKNSTKITSEMLPLISLSQADIDMIISQVPGGIANIQDIYGLTPLQDGMLFHHLLSKEGDPYLLVSRLRFTDRTSIERYADAMQLAIGRHDILRVAIFWDGLSEPAQVVLRQVPSLLTKIKFAESDKPALEQLNQKFHAHRYRLDLTQAPLLRLLAAPDSEGSWVALQIMHHLIDDYSSLQILHAEIYAIVVGKIETLTKPTPFRHFVAQVRLRTSPTEHIQLFTQMLGDIDEPTLPFGLRDVHQDGSEINKAHLKLSPRLSDQLRVHARNLQVSLASICHLAWAQVLAAASERKAVVFGTVLLGRLQAGESNSSIMGPMINTLPIRLNIDERSVETSVYDAHTQLSALLALEHTPLVLAQRCSNVPVGVPLFSALLNYRHKQVTKVVNMSIPGVSFLEYLEQTNYPLTISLDDDDNENSLSISLEVVSPMSATRICAYMQQSLESLVDALTHSPQQATKNLRMMPPGERSLLLHIWNQTTVIHLSNCCLHQLFEAQVEYDGKSIAVECKGKSLSYSELNMQSNRLAHHIIAQGVKPDDRIALCVERSNALVVGILGILKAGCAYVPLDPSYSSQRVTNILLDSNPILLVSDQTGRGTLRDHGVPMIELEKPLPVDIPIENPDTAKIGLTAAHLAYIIYTSGSTGTPKGVMVEQQQIVRLFEATDGKFDFNKQDKWCLFHSISFDFSVWEVWGALVHGNRLTVPSYTVIQSMDEFYDWICIHGVSVLNQTPSAFKMFSQVFHIGSRSHCLRYIILGGEWLDPLIAKHWYAKYGGKATILVNMYGITESAVHATHQRIETRKNIDSIGRPLPDLCFYLLNSRGEPALLGSNGEIYIGGAGVARGYLNRYELTAERFLPDPFNTDPTARMYRTGDLARYLPDGNLVFMGRVDAQVKIRGFRIEPGEIEARLIEHPNVYETVVQPYGNGSDARLVAYVVADADPSLVQNLRAYLLNLLPDYMVPAAYVCLSSLPLTPSGKLDRRSLPAPDDEAFARQLYEAPQGEMEEKLAQIWSEMLSIDRISRHDNFFALGGHSLLVVRLLAQLRQIELESTVREVFEAPTLAVLASMLSSYNTVTVPANLISKDSTEITPQILPLISLSQADIDTIIAQVPGGIANIQDIYGLTPIQNGMLYHHLITEEGDPYLLVSRLHFVDKTTLNRYADALTQMIERHDILRTAVYWKGLNEPAQVVLRQVPSPLTEITLAETDKPVLEQLSQKFHAHRYRLDLTQVPLLRVTAAPESNGSWMAVQLMHHLIADHITLERLQTEIHSIMDGRTKMMATITPFRNFVAQVRSGMSPAEHTQFFTEMLGDIDEPTLPFGLRDVDQDGSEINEADLKLSQTLNDQLRAHARKLQVSLASICHLAWAHVLAKTSERKAVVFGTVLLGRLQAGEGNSTIMGPMINTLPIRMNINEKSVENAVCDAHTKLSALLTHEHTPLVLAQRCSSVPVGLPLFSALLNYRHNQEHGVIDSPLSGVTVIDVEERSNYPVTMSIEDNFSTLGLTVQIVSSVSATRICAYVQQSLESLVDALTHSPQQSVGNMRVMPPDELILLLHTWNQTIVNQSRTFCLHQLFETQVECNRQAIAIEYNGQNMSYSQLNVGANLLAHYLTAKGVKAGDLIALCVERSMKLVIAILGILKAGCAYVPLDPIYSSQRLTNILLDADPTFLLADSTGRNTLGDHQIPVIDLEEQLPSDLPINNLDVTKLELSPTHLAYVIYTSGSTGTPKGVMIEHQPAAKFFVDIRNKFDLKKEDNCCLFHSISFDISIWEIWNAFCYGSQLSIVPYRTIYSSDEFYNWISTNRITVLTQTSSALKILMRSKNNSSRFDRLRYIFFGAESSDQIIIGDWYKNNGNNQTILVHMYGPTETLMVATSWNCDINSPKPSVIPIGYPLKNRRIYLLNSHGEPVLMGVEGEICIGGNILARGYLNRVKQTTERFLPDAFIDDPTARMYRTGDLARYLPDGNMIFLGRVDQQVKIHGYRIEPGEIEGRLVEHPNVHAAVVQPYGNGSNERLVAYVVADADPSLVQNLRAHLLNLLPDYMVPAAYVCLSSLPLTPSGKLDRRSLPAPDDEAFARQLYEAPQGEMEEKLAQIWRKMLSIDRISRHDNFFALGGHSLLVVRLLAQLRQIGLDSTVRKVFDAPTLAVLASVLSSYNAVAVPPNLISKDSTVITPEMLPLISLSQADIDTIISQVPGGVANIQDIYGLTPVQNGMLYHHLMAKEGDPYLLVSRLHFVDRTTLNRYADTLTQIIERHDILRTAIYWKGLNEPAQVVLRQVPSLLTEITLDESDKPVLEQLSQKFHAHRYRLDLTQAPLLQLMSAPESDGSWMAVQLMHHSIGDHITSERLQAEIHSIMDGKTEMVTTVTPFRNFVAQVRSGMSPAEHTRFFTKMLGDIDEPTLPFGLSDVDQDGSGINEADLKLSQKLNDLLRAHARKLQVSLASICHLAWAQVLAKTSERKVVVFGTVLLGRLQAGEGNSSIMGPMINTLPIRVNIDERSVEAAVCDAHTQLSALLVHDHTPLVLAQRCSSVPVGLPLFSALLNYRHNQEHEVIDAQLRGVSVIDVEERTNYPITLSVEDNFSTLGLTVQIVSSVSATRICAYMQQSLESLVDALTHSPQQSVRKLRVMPPDERNILFYSWNQTTITNSSVCCLHRIFEAQVKFDEQAIAIECEGRTLSYSELNIQANRIAHYLISKGIKPDDRIALCVERSTAMIVAILGILKAGCAYVPLDPVYTSQRLINILHDAGPIFLLADATGRKALDDHQVPMIDLEKPLFSDSPVYNPNTTKLRLTPAHLAYVIYTSGSTGTPKGVMVEHQQIVRLFGATRDKFSFNKQDKWCSFASISFDVSVWEIWSVFFYGSELLIPSYKILRSMDDFYDWICTNSITVLNPTFSAFKALIRVKKFNGRFDRLRYVLIGGDELDPIIVKEWCENYQKSKTTLFNMYGTTETAVQAIIQRLDNSNNVHSIGRQIHDLRVYLLDSFGEPTLIGTEGEIYISGPGVARGYLNRTELTAERFLTDPFNNDPAARMYRTGDRARYLSDGSLVFLGRTDQQVKIRGFRIELGEIEARLVEHPDVHEAVVRSYRNGSDTRLVAYMVADEETSLVQNLRTYLSNLLPEYMVPAAYVCLPSLPLTPNGKLDSQALPVPDDESFARQQYEAPQGEIERKLAHIWGELLCIDRIGRNDNFFELGGHSLHVIHIVNKVELHNMHIDAHGLFSFPILKSLAEQIENRPKRFYCDEAIPIRRHGKEGPLFLLPDGSGNTSYAFELAHNIDKNIPVYVLPWSSPEKHQPSSLEEMAIAMIPLIKKVYSNDSNAIAIAGYCAGGTLAFEIAKQLINNGYNVSFLGLIDTYATYVKPIFETKWFLSRLLNKFQIFNTISTVWMDRVGELTLNEAIKELQKTKLDLNNIDFEWEALLCKQSITYLKMCEAYKINTLPIKIHIFRASDFYDDNTNQYDELEKKLFNYPKLGWEISNPSTNFNVVAIDGDHSAMVKDPKNRSILGAKLTECLLSKTTK